jgi:hypothetical protein
MSGGLNAGDNHSSPNGEGITLCSLWLGGVLYAYSSYLIRKIAMP